MPEVYVSILSSPEYHLGELKCVIMSPASMGELFSRVTDASFCIDPTDYARPIFATDESLLVDQHQYLFITKGTSAGFQLSDLMLARRFQTMAVSETVPAEFAKRC
jgi:hypothetical protein